MEYIINYIPEEIKPIFVLGLLIFGMACFGLGYIIRDYKDENVQ